MPHIRPDCAEQSATNFLIEHRRKPNSLAARLTRDVLLLRSAGSSRRAIAAALNLSQRRVQTILDGAALAVRSRRRPFVMRERDADYASVEAALRAGSTMRAEHPRYATRCPAPYSYSYFWRRFADWLDAQPDPASGDARERIFWRNRRRCQGAARRPAATSGLPRRWRPLRASLAFLAAASDEVGRGALWAPRRQSPPSFACDRKFAFPRRTPCPRPSDSPEPLGGAPP